MKTNIIKRIESIIDNLPEAEYKIACAIIEYPNDIIKMTSKQLATRANSSASAVIRLCKRIDVGSFTSLKVNISSELQHPQSNEYLDIDANESINDLKRKLLGNAVQSITDTLEQVNDVTLNKVVDTLINSDTIISYGVGASYLVAENLMQKLSRIGKKIIALQDTHILIPFLSTLDLNSSLIVFSNSGNTNEALELVGLANKRGIKSIAVTQFGTGKLKEMAEYTLFTTKSNEKLNRSAATSSLHAQFILIDLLFSLYFIKDYEANTIKIKDSRKIIKEYKKLS